MLFTPNTLYILRIQPTPSATAATAQKVASQAGKKCAKINHYPLTTH